MTARDTLLNNSTELNETLSKQNVLVHALSAGETLTVRDLAVGDILLNNSTELNETLRKQNVLVHAVAAQRP
jgi:hypothetical protein